MLSIKTFPTQADIVQLQNDTRELLERAEYKAEMSAEAAVLQVKAQKAVWRLPAVVKLFGGVSTLTIQVLLLSSGTSISIHDGRMTSLVAAIVLFAAGLFGGTLTAGTGCVLWLPMLVPLYAAYEQYVMSRRLWDMLNGHMARVAYG